MVVVLGGVDLAGGVDVAGFVDVAVVVEVRSKTIQSAAAYSPTAVVSGDFHYLLYGKCYTYE